GFRVESHYVIVLSAHVNPAVSERNSASASYAECFYFRPLILIGPDRPARGRLDRVDIILHAFKVEDAIDDQWCGLEPWPESRGARRASSGERPDRQNGFYISASDLT